MKIMCVFVGISCCVLLVIKRTANLCANKDFKSNNFKKNQGERFVSEPSGKELIGENVLMG